MNWIQTIRMALKSIAHNKVRTFLTMLGIIIGVGAVIALVASIQGMATLTRLQFEAMGTNQIQVHAWGVKSADWKAMEGYLDGELADRIKGWSPQSQYYDWQSKGVQYRSKTLKSDNSYTYIYFGNEDYGMVTNRTVSAGRDLTETDCKTNARVCVIGETIRKYFFGAMSPIDQSIRIGGQSFKIVGVYKGKYGGKLNSEDQMIVLPYTLQSQMMRSSDSDRQYFIQAASKEDIQPVVDALKDFMSTRYDPNNGYFDCDSTSQYMDQVEASSNQLALLGGGIAAISLLVGGIGIMNIMLVSVTERTREIGIRMAIGARRRDIIGQFLIEAAVVSCCGGLIGILLGCFGSAVIGNLLLAQQMNSWMPEVEQFTVLPSPGLVVGAFLFSALLGIIFGLYPASKASKLQPVEALRTQ
ncbi:MAG: ABC transporter permease [Butyricicoccus sp.]|nr:ABC transporter permease [Butyricicoccus pullicaecorum]MDY5971806.1 ABC transporter permease [Butyricicoccus sp.]